MNLVNIECTGASGVKYVYMAAYLDQPWRQDGGNYLFGKWTGQVWIAQYFGECESFATRMPPNHERWAEAVRDYGVTRVFAHTTPGGEKARKGEERDLIAAYNPPMNVQHRTNALTGGLGALSYSGPLLSQLGGLSPLAQSILRGKK